MLEENSPQVGVGEREEQEQRKERPNKMDVAARADGNGAGGSCGDCAARLLASEDELAGAGPGAFLPGLSGLWDQAAF